MSSVRLSIAPSVSRKIEDIAVEILLISSGNEKRQGPGPILTPEKGV